MTTIRIILSVIVFPFAAFLTSIISMMMLLVISSAHIANRFEEDKLSKYEKDENFYLCVLCFELLCSYTVEFIKYGTITNDQNGIF